jgi:protein-disulfide isomerase
MKKLMLLAVAVACVSACTAESHDNRALEKKIDDLSKKIDNLVARGGAGAAAPQRARPEPDRSKTYAVPIDGDAVDGPADAKVTLVKAYDYACPYCEKVRNTMDDLRKKYGNDLRIVYKQYVVHPQIATAGALAVCAANKQGKFMQMDQLLWEKGFNARTFDKDAGSEKCYESAAGCPVVLGFAQELGLNADKFKADMKGECLQLIQKDQKDLQQLGVSATPSFFVNGRFMSGAMPIDNFVSLIDEELKKANDKIAAGTPAASYYQQVVLDKGLKQLTPAQ